MEKLFVRFTTLTAKVAGKPWTFGVCVAVVLVWALSGPVFGFTDTWQLVINTGTTVVTFLMVFLIQNTQNRDGAAMQAKLDELLYATARAKNRFVGIEHLTDRELDAILAEVEQRAVEIHAERRARAQSGGRQAEVSRAQPARARPKGDKATRRKPASPSGRKPRK